VREWIPTLPSELPFKEFRDSNLGVPGQNDIWVLVPWPCIKNNIRGKVVGSLKSGPWWFLWIRVCPWLVRALTNLLFSLCKSVWIIDLLVTFPRPYPEAPTRPFTLEVLGAKERAPTPRSFIVFTLDSHLSLLRSLPISL
jgi:hypothetical protein